MVRKPEAEFGQLARRRVQVQKTESQQRHCGRPDSLRGLVVLEKVRLGTVWDQGRLVGVTVLDRVEFLSDFSDGLGLLTSNRNGDPTPNGADWRKGYDSGETRSWSLWLMASAPTHGRPPFAHVMIPCVEFFTRCWGGSEELRRRLIGASSWALFEKDAFRAKAVPRAPGHWAIDPAPGLDNVRDVSFLAHVAKGHCEFSRRAAMHLTTHLSNNYDPNSRTVELRAPPWFDGPVHFAVEGVPINDGADFLALRVDGMSYPSGAPTIDVPDSTSGTGCASEDGSPGTSKFDDDRPTLLVNQAPPMRGGQPIDLHSVPFEILGHPPKLSKSNKTTAGIGKTKVANGLPDYRWPIPGAVGLPYGHRSDAHRTTFEPVDLPTQGVLRNLWATLESLQNAGRIGGLRWFTTDKGMQQGPSPMTEPLYAQEADRPPASRWGRIVASSLRPRGLMLASFRHAGETVHLIELERRLSSTGVEEGFFGLAVRNLDTLALADWLPQLKQAVLKEEALSETVRATCSLPARAHRFKHGQGDDGRPDMVRAVTNALRGLGLPGA